MRQTRQDTKCILYITSRRDDVECHRRSSQGTHVIRVIRQAGGRNWRRTIWAKFVANRPTPAGSGIIENVMTIALNAAVTPLTNANGYIQILSEN